jgi:hypothetical protein
VVLPAAAAAARRVRAARRAPRAAQRAVAQDATYLYLLQCGCCQSTLSKVIK